MAAVYFVTSAMLLAKISPTIAHQLATISSFAVADHFAHRCAIADRTAGDSSSGALLKLVVPWQRQHKLTLNAHIHHINALWFLVLAILDRLVLFLELACVKQGIATLQRCQIWHHRGLHLVDNKSLIKVHSYYMLVVGYVLLIDSTALKLRWWLEEGSTIGLQRGTYRWKGRRSSRL